MIVYMKNIENIKEELMQNLECTNIPLCYKDEIWEWMEAHFTGTSIQIGDMMNSREYGCCATVGSSGIQAYMTERDYDTYLMAV